MVQIAADFMKRVTTPSGHHSAVQHHSTSVRFYVYHIPSLPATLQHMMHVTKHHKRYCPARLGSLPQGQLKIKIAMITCSAATHLSTRTLSAASSSSVKKATLEQHVKSQSRQNVSCNSKTLDKMRSQIGKHKWHLVGVMSNLLLRTSLHQFGWLSPHLPVFAVKLHIPALGDQSLPHMSCCCAPSPKGPL